MISILKPGVSLILPVLASTDSSAVGKEVYTSLQALHSSGLRATSTLDLFYFWNSALGITDKLSGNTMLWTEQYPHDEL